MMKQFLVMLNPMSSPKREKRGLLTTAEDAWESVIIVLESDGGTGKQYELGRQRGGKQEFTSCKALNVTEFFNIPMCISCKCLVLSTVDFGACRAWIPWPFLQAKFWHLFLRGQREIQEAENKKRRKGESWERKLILHEL